MTKQTENIYTLAAEVSTCMYAYVIKAKNIDEAVNIYAKYSRENPDNYKTLKKEEKMIMFQDEQGYYVTIKEADFDSEKIIFIADHEG